MKSPIEFCSPARASSQVRAPECMSGSLESTIVCEIAVAMDAFFTKRSEATLSIQRSSSNPPEQGKVEPPDRRWKTPRPQKRASHLLKCPMSRTALPLVLALLNGCAAAPQPPPEVAASVRATLADMTPPGGQTPDATHLVTQVAVSEAGNDWLVDYSRTVPRERCGSGGCTYQLWVRRPRGYALVFNQQVHEWRVRRGRPNRLDITIHGSNCDLSAVAPCRRSYLWEEAGGRLVETTNQNGDGYLVGPLFQVADLDETRFPEAIKAEVDRRNKACRDQGGAVDGTDYAAVPSPDLNGDGVRDWIVGSRFSGCVLPDAEGRVSGGVSVWTSRGEDFTEALKTIENGYAVDVRSVPARFGVRLDETCLSGPACPTRFYIWSEGALAPL